MTVALASAIGFALSGIATDKVTQPTAETGKEIGNGHSVVR